MFGRNEVVGQKYFADAEDKLFITSLFVTLQGEGPFAGQPSVFVRFAKCNLSCSFCDTYFDDGDWLTLDEIEVRIDNAILKYYDNEVPNWMQFNDFHKRQAVLVVTGGEPMLQKNIFPFLTRMNKIFENTQIESNGTVWQEIPEETILVCSPKCAEKNGKPTQYLKPNMKVFERADCLKFVMSHDQESPYSSIPDWAIENAYNIRVYISPMNIYNKEPQRSKQLRTTNNEITIEERSEIDEVISFWEEGLLNMSENQKNHEYAAKYCIKNGCKLNLQIHLYASLA